MLKVYLFVKKLFSKHFRLRDLSQCIVSFSFLFFSFIEFLFVLKDAMYASVRKLYFIFKCWRYRFFWHFWFRHFRLNMNLYSKYTSIDGFWSNVISISNILSSIKKFLYWLKLNPYLNKHIFILNLILTPRFSSSKNCCCFFGLNLNETSLQYTFGSKYGLAPNFQTYWKSLNKYKFWKETI